jgi:membrane protease YdiL (CAAX protease family)
VSVAASQWNRKLAAWLGFVLAIAAVNYSARFSSGPPAKDVLYRWDTAVGSAIEFGIFLVIVFAIARGATELLGLRRPKNWGAAFGAGVAVLVGIYLLTAILSPILHPGQEQGLTPDKWDASRAAPFFANAFVVCVVAPFVEELTFRGVGYSLLRARFGVEPAIVGSALCFGLAHGLVEALPLLVAFGIGLAWIRERQDSVIPGMLVHGTFNALALAASLFVHG